MKNIQRDENRREKKSIKLCGSYDIAFQKEHVLAIHLIRIRNQEIPAKEPH